MKNLIIFDLDGTIEDSRMDMSLSVNRIRKLYNLPELPLEVVQSLVNKGMDFLYRNCFPELIQNNYIPEDLKFKYEMDYSEHIIDYTRLYEGMDNVIQQLSQKNDLILYTNKPEKLSKLLLEKLQLLNYFISIIGGDSYPESKPSEKPIISTIDKLKLNPKEIYVIGDTEADILTAKNLKAKSIWCKWGYTKKTPDIPPDYIAVKPLDILEIID
jgi:phosphoglycolate phosphatase